MDSQRAVTRDDFRRACNNPAYLPDFRTIPMEVHGVEFTVCKHVSGAYAVYHKGVEVGEVLDNVILTYIERRSDEILKMME